MKNKTPGEIVRSPEAQSLWRECEMLRDEVARLLTEAHDLMQVVEPNLIALYQTKLGAWELKRLQLQCAVARLKRKITLIQARVNRGERVFELELEGQLDLELLDWRTRVDEAVAALEEAKSRLAHPMEDEEAKELRDIYRALVKRLHPDVRPDLTDEELRLWHRVREAYDRGDLEELRALALIQPRSVEGPTHNAIEQLAKKRDDLKAHVTRLLAKIAEIESQPPFTLRKQLGNAEWVEMTRKNIDEACALLEAERAELEMLVDKTLAVAQNANGFSRN